MAKTQSRRCISLNRIDYESAKQEAARRGVSLSGLVEAGLAALGVPLVAHPRQSPELVRAAIERRAESMAARRDQIEGQIESPPRPSRERQMLGDAIANACGFA